MSRFSERNFYVLSGVAGALILREAFAYWRSKRADDVLVLKENERTTSLICDSQIGSEHPFVCLKDKYEDCVYMDYNATTPIWPEVTAVMMVCPD
jgi:hypothetical protein